MTDGNWMAHLDDEDRETLLAEVFAALRIACVKRDIAPLETCLQAWRVTAEALSDPVRREVLTGPLSDEDFVEVGRPA